MNIKRFSLLTILIGFLTTVAGAISPFLYLLIYTNQIGAIIIGGADAPTYKYILLNTMNGLFFCLLLLGITLIITGLFCLVFSKTVKNNCNIITTLTALGLSVVGALGISCVLLWFSNVAFNEVSRHPIEYLFSVFGGLGSFFVFLFLIAVYLKARVKIWSVKGFLIDVLTGIMFLPILVLIILNLISMMC